MNQDLRSVLDRLEAHGRLRRIPGPVSRIFELAAVSRFAQLDNELKDDVLLFEQVEGSELRVVANLFSRRENVALALGVEEPELLARGVHALDHPIPPVLRDSGPCAGVHMPLGSGANMHALISIRKEAEGEAQKPAFAAFAHQDLIKHVFVVDGEIDLRDPAEVDYALATRVKADRDIFIIPRVRGVPLDPAADEYEVGKATVAKMIVDATKPLDASADAYRMAEVPDSALERVRRDRRRYFGP